MTGGELYTFLKSLNGDAPIDDTLASTLIGIAKTIFQGERDWMVLRKTDTSLSFTSNSTWQTAYSLANITDFSRFYGKTPIKVFDGTNGIEYYTQVPWSQRLAYKDEPNTFVYDEANKRVYFNGTNSMGGTIYLDYIKTTPAISLLSTVDIETAGLFPFPGDYHPVLAFYAVGIHKGAIDYDEINRQMLPSNQATLIALKNAAEKWDTQKQVSEVENTDPYRGAAGSFTPNRVNMSS